MEEHLWCKRLNWHLAVTSWVEHWAEHKSQMFVQPVSTTNSFLSVHVHWKGANAFGNQVACDCSEIQLLIDPSVLDGFSMLHSLWGLLDGILLDEFGSLVVVCTILVASPAGPFGKMIQKASVGSNCMSKTEWVISIFEGFTVFFFFLCLSETNMLCLRQRTIIASMQAKSQDNVDGTTQRTTTKGWLPGCHQFWMSPFNFAFFPHICQASAKPWITLWPAGPIRNQWKSGRNWLAPVQSSKFTKHQRKQQTGMSQSSWIQLQLHQGLHNT